MNAALSAREVKAALRGLSEINAAALHKLARETANSLKQEPGDEVLACAGVLANDAALRVRLVGFLLVAAHPGALAAVDGPALTALGGKLEGWSDVDTFCLLSGRAWRAGQVSDRFFRSWAKSPDRWRRRAAIVSTVALNVKAQGGDGDAKRTLMMCDLLAEDRDDMVVKGLSWALRALCVRNRDAVAAFVAANRERLACRVIREVQNKLRTGLKTPKRGSMSRRGGKR